MINPVASGEVSAPFGERINPVTGEEEFHNGVDIAVPENTEVLAVSDGKVITVSYNDTIGNYVTYETTSGYTVTYGHLNEVLVEEGQKVSQGQVIALSGTTGQSTGPHLHYSVKYNGEYIDAGELLQPIE